MARYVRKLVLAAALLLLLGCLACSEKGELVALETEAPKPTPTATATPVENSIKAEPTQLTLTLPPATATPTPAATAAPTADPFAGYELHYHESSTDFFYVKLTEELKTRITGLSYPADDRGAPIDYDELRYIHILYVDFDGVTHEGELIVNRLVAAEVTDIFYQLYKASYPLASVRLVDDYGEPFNDNLSMADNNSSAFCFRKVTGSNKYSRHAYGLAIDINPVMNPYIDGDRVAPAAGEAYLDRSLKLRGMIDHSDLCYKLFISYGWTWGGDFRGDKDYQHFSKTVEGYD